MSLEEMKKTAEVIKPIIKEMSLELYKQKPDNVVN